MSDQRRGVELAQDFAEQLFRLLGHDEPDKVAAVSTLCADAELRSAGQIRIVSAPCVIVGVSDVGRLLAGLRALDAIGFDEAEHWVVTAPMGGTVIALCPACARHASTPFVTVSKADALAMQLMCRGCRAGVAP